MSISFPEVLIPEEKRLTVKKKGNEFFKALATFEGLFGVAAEALGKIKKLDLSSLDPLGTVCVCHVHAYYIAAIGREFLAGAHFSTELERSLKAIQHKRNEAKTIYDSLINLDSQEKRAKFESYVGKVSCQLTLREVLHKLNLTVSLSTKVHYLIITYLLTITKDYKQITIADNLICEHCHVPITENDGVYKKTTNSKKLVNWIRKCVDKEVNSTLLEKHVCAIAITQLIKESHKFIESVSCDSANVRHLLFLEKNVKNVEGKLEYPDYYTLTTVFQSALYQKFPVILLFKKYTHLGHVYNELDAKFDTGIFLLPSEKPSYFEPKPLPPGLKNLAVMVVIAKKNGDKPSAFLRQLMHEFDFLHLCKLDGAQHKQYTDSQLHQTPSVEIRSLQEDKFAREAKKLDNLRNEAMIKGFTINSPNARLSLSHIFADTLEPYRTAEFVQFFAEAAQCYAEQKQPPLTSPNLNAQFAAADKRKELHRSNDRSLLALTPTLSEPDMSERIDDYLTEITTINFSSLLADLSGNMSHVSLLDDTNVRKTQERSKSALLFPLKVDEDEFF